MAEVSLQAKVDMLTAGIHEADVERQKLGRILVALGGRVIDGTVESDLPEQGAAYWKQRALEADEKVSAVQSKLHRLQSEFDDARRGGLDQVHRLVQASQKARSELVKIVGEKDETRLLCQKQARELEDLRSRLAMIRAAIGYPELGAELKGDAQRVATLVLDDVNSWLRKTAVPARAPASEHDRDGSGTPRSGAV